MSKAPKPSRAAEVLAFRPCFDVGDPVCLRGAPSPAPTGVVLKATFHKHLPGNADINATYDVRFSNDPDNVLICAEFELVASGDAEPFGFAQRKGEAS